MDQFWCHHPALLYGLAIFLGSSIGLSFAWPLFIPLTFLFGPLLFFPFLSLALGKRLMLALLLALLAFTYTSQAYQFPDLPLEGVKGQGIFTPDSLQTTKLHFGQFWIFQGTLTNFSTDPNASKETIKRLKCTFSLPVSTLISRPLVNRAYYLQGTLKKSLQGYIFIPQRYAAWLPVESSSLISLFNLVEWRFRLKQQLASFIKKNLKHQESGQFLAGIATGNFEESLMIYEFSRFGVQHIMAISGFHFALLAAVLGSLLKLFFPQKLSFVILISLLSIYLIFLGKSPSVLRAYCTITLMLIGYLIHKKGSGLNFLGIALILTTLLDPLLIHTIGFQFSFATTAAILLFFPLAQRLCQCLFARRSLSQAISMPLGDQHGYIALTLLRESLALSLAVNSVALPLTFYYFHLFPALSLIYNLFFPLFVSFSLLLLILGGIGSLVVPLLGNFIHYINSYYTVFILNFTSAIPPQVDILWRVEECPQWLIFLYFSLLFYLGMALQAYFVQQKATLKDFDYL